MRASLGPSCSLQQPNGRLRDDIDDLAAPMCPNCLRDRFRLRSLSATWISEVGADGQTGRGTIAKRDVKRPKETCEKKDNQAYYKNDWHPDTSVDIVVRDVNGQQQRSSTLQQLDLATTSGSEKMTPRERQSPWKNPLQRLLPT